LGRRLVGQKQVLLSGLLALDRALLEFESLRSDVIRQLEASATAVLPEWRQRIYRIGPNTLELLKRIQWPKSQHRIRYNLAKRPGERPGDLPLGVPEPTTAEDVSLTSADPSAEVAKHPKPVRRDLDDDVSDETMMEEDFEDQQVDALLRQHNAQLEDTAMLPPHLVDETTDYASLIPSATAHEYGQWPAVLRSLQDLKKQRTEQGRYTKYNVRLPRAVRRQAKVPTPLNSELERADLLARTDPGFAFTATWWDHIRSLRDLVGGAVPKELMAVTPKRPAHLRVADKIESATAASPSFTIISPAERAKAAATAAKK